jgi:enamine deaminase RidA (YjgF/YER057c/UK114 family)
MQKVPIHSAGLADPIGPFMRGVRVGDLVVISGTSALSHLSGPFAERVLPTTFDEQARQTVTNLKTALDGAGVGWDDVFKLLVILKQSSDYPRFTALRSELIPTNAMASTAIIAGLPRDDMLIEIEAWAALPDSDAGPGPIDVD